MPTSPPSRPAAPGPTPAHRTPAHRIPAHRIPALLARSLGVVALVGSLAAQGALAPAGTAASASKLRTAPFAGLTDTRVEVTNFHPEPFTAIDTDSAGRIWSINPYASQVLRYQPGATEPDRVLATGLNPVSVRVWEPTPTTSDWRVLVACVGTHALFVHDLVTGEVLEVLRLESEPADLAIDPERQLAFVSCQGTNAVLRVNLASMRVTGRYELPVGERPGPLYFDPGPTQNPSDDRLYVAAAVTGNNTTLFREEGADFGVVRSLEGFAGGELPDHDVYRIHPGTDLVDAAVRGAGSLLFDLERNPLTGDLWILSTNSLNADPEKQSEPLINGEFVVNEVRIVPGVGAATGLVQAPPGVDLDDVEPLVPGPQYSFQRSVNQARTVAFAPDGSAYVASPLSRAIAHVDAAGGRIEELVLPEDAQCYDLELLPGSPAILLAHCLGTMTLEVFVLDGSSAVPTSSMSLGPDPTPGPIRRGRDAFLDGRRSKDGRSSCSACHPRGMSDQLGWQISGLPFDVKDVMVTQSLMSIGDTFPYHWRGERDLLDFQKAFQGLLGAPALLEPTPGEMADLVTFLESLQAPANPIESPRRILDDRLTAEPLLGVVGSAVAGQDVFHEIPNASQLTCVECHPMGSGTTGNMFTEGAGLTPRAINQEVAHLRQLQNKGTTHVWIDKDLDGDEGPAGSDEQLDERTNVNGFGVTHNGNPATLFEFIEQFLQLNTKEHVHVLRFLEQWDQGISPAVHWAALLDADTSPLVVRDIDEILVAGALAGWNDVVAFGRYDSGSGPEPVRWAFDPLLELFLPDAVGVAPLTWPELRAETQAGLASNVVLGLPLENGRRFGIDFDNDGLRNGAEVNLGLDPWDPDSDGDGWWDGHELQNGGDPGSELVGSFDVTPPVLVDAVVESVTARSAKLYLRFNEDVTYTIDYGVPGGPQRTVSRNFFSRVDTANLTHNEPGTGPGPEFAARITLTDRAGNVTGPVALPSFVPLSTQVSVNFPPFLHVEELVVTEETRPAPDTLHVEARVRIASHVGAPDFLVPGPMMVFLGVSVQDPVTGLFEKPDTFTTPLDTSFQIWNFTTEEVEPYEAAPGGLFLVSPLTDAAGETTVSFDQAGLVPGQQVRLTVLGIVGPTPGMPGVYDGISLGQMQPLLLEDVGDVVLEF